MSNLMVYEKAKQFPGFDKMSSVAKRVLDEQKFVMIYKDSMPS